MKSLNSIPRVSVITPTYNRADLLARSIESVLAQTYNNFELIVVDDGSTDGTQDVLSRYKDPRLKIVQFEQNRGIGAARYQGVNQAKGEWLSFLDADDLWSSHKLACDLSVLDRHPEVNLLFDNYRNFNHVENVDKCGFDQSYSSFALLTTTQLETGIFRIESGLAEALLAGNLIGTASIITIHRTVFDRIGNFNPILSGPEDFELLWRAALAGVTFAYQTQVLVERHKDGASITARIRSFAPRLLDALDLCEVSLYSHQRNELLALLNQVRGRTWISLIYACALEGRRHEAREAFRNSLRYGFTSESLIYFLAALAGPKMITWAKQFVKKS